MAENKPTGNPFMDLRTAATGLALLLVTTACGGGSQASTTTEPTAVDPGNVATGAEVYMRSCASCHGGDATGVTGLGAPLVGNVFIAGQNETDLAQFIEIGRERNDPDNTSGVDMPPKGGNPSLDNQDLRDVAAYLLSLNR